MTTDCGQLWLSGGHAEWLIMEISKLPFRSVLRVAAGTLGVIGLVLVVVDWVLLRTVLADTPMWFHLVFYLVGPALFFCGRHVYLRLKQAEVDALRVMEPE